MGNAIDRYQPKVATLALVGFLMVSLATTTWAKSPTYKTTTPIPPEVTTPDKVETSIGTLTFFDGVPTDETVKTAHDNLDRQRGVEAFLNCMPGV
jgi:hypothetical protein